MKFYDMDIRGRNFDNDLALIKEAYKFGWDYLNLNYSPDNFKRALSYKDELLEEISNFNREDSYRNKYNDDSIGISMGINIRDVNSNDLRRIIKRNRDKSQYISVFGGDLKLNRSACESYQVDVLSRPYFARRDSGMNHVLAKEAVRNNVTIELCFRDILKNHLKYRANVISHFKEILKFHRKYRFPLILTTDSKSIYDVRSTRDIVSFFKSIGFTNEEIYNGFYYYPRQIIEFNSQRKNMIVRGVKVIEGASDFTEKAPKTPDYNEYLKNEGFCDEESFESGCIEDGESFEEGLCDEESFEEGLCDEESFEEGLCDEESFEEGLCDEESFESECIDDEEYLENEFLDNECDSNYSNNEKEDL